MALILKDRVRETSTVSGLADAVLLGAVTGFQAFSVVGNTNTCYYTIADNVGNWEVGIGTYSTSGPTLARTTVLDSSSGGAKVNFPVGSKDVFLTYPAEKAVYFDASDNVGLGVVTPGVALDVSGTIRSASNTIASAATITPTAGTTNQYTVTALATDATIAIPSGTPIDGQKLIIRIKDDGTARLLTWTTTAGGYRVIGTVLPNTTVINKTNFVGCIYNSADGFWDVVASVQEV